jgi:hypothetical protein
MPNAIRALRNLEVWLQELVLDAVDQAAGSAESLRVRGILNEAVIDFIQERSGTRWYLFIVVRVFRRTRHLAIMKIHAYSRHADMKADPPSKP